MNIRNVDRRIFRMQGDQQEVDGREGAYGRLSLIFDRHMLWH